MSKEIREMGEERALQNREIQKGYLNVCTFLFPLTRQTIFQLMQFLHVLFLSDQFPFLHMACSLHDKYLVDYTSVIFVCGKQEWRVLSFDFDRGKKY